MRSKLTLLATLLALAAASSQNLFATNATVGLCAGPGTHYVHIQDAVTAVQGTLHATVNVCPETYAEQVVITGNLTLKGVSGSNHGAAVITAPGTGMVGSSVMDVYTAVPVAAQILVNASGASVTIDNVTVDGSNNGISSCSPELVGIFYQNSSGTVTRTNVLNEVYDPADDGCQGGQGIYVQSSGGGSSTVAITYNNVENYQKNGIVARQPFSTANINNNTVTGQGVTSGAAENSIEIAFGATGSITYNTVSADEYIDAATASAAGILVYQGYGVTISHNTVSNTQTGIGVYPVSPGDSDSASITYNNVSSTHTYDGIDVCSNFNTVGHNTVNGSDEAGIHLDSSCTGASVGDTVSGNTINGACAGILVGSGSSTPGANTFYNAATLVLTGTDTCSTPLIRQNGKAKALTAAKVVQP